MRESSTLEDSATNQSKLGLILDPGTAQDQGRPLLDPTRWTPRHRYFVLVGLGLAVAAGLVKSAQAGPLIGGVSGIRAFLAAAFAVGLVGLAASLRGLTLPGAVIGGLFIVAGMLSWAYTGTPIVVWAVLALEGALFAIWTFPWVRDWVRLPRLGAAWLGLAYWYLGVIGALLVWRPNVTAQRIAYAGVFTLGAIAVVTATRRSRRDLSVGIVAAFLGMLALLFFVGSGNALASLHPVPANGWGAHMQYRFWGATGLLYHPNSIAIVAVMICLRIGADRAFERWQRYAALAGTTVTLLLVNSRTGLAYLGLAAVVYALLVLRQQWLLRRGAEVPDDGLDRFSSPRQALGAALLPLLACAVIAVGSGGVAFLTANRYSSDGDDGDMTSGRRATWSAVIDEFKADSVAEKLFGDAKTSRAIVRRPGSNVNLTTDNSAVGALRRGGVLGELSYLLGLGLLLWHGVRGAGGRRPPVWFTVSAVGSLASIPFADWLLGGTGGTLWIFLLAGEAALLFTPARPE